MPRISHRTGSLTRPQQIAFLQVRVPGRISAIQSVLQHQPTYKDLAVAAIFSRAIASFLGIGTSSGRLCADRKYFQHSPGQSWEVKIKNVGGEFVDVDALCHADKSALEQGINETNTAFAHLTFWPDPSSQNQSGLATDAYIQSQTQQIRIFADTVIRLFHERVARANPA